MNFKDKIIINEMVKYIEVRIKSTVIILDNPNVIEDINDFVNSKLSNDLKIKALNEFNKLVLFSGTYIGPDSRGHFIAIKEKGLKFLYSKTNKDLVNNIKELKDVEKVFEKSAIDLEKMVIEILKGKEKFKDILF